MRAWLNAETATGIFNYHSSLQCSLEATMANTTQEIVVTDIKIPFISMVVLMVKWALAAIPAFIILISLGVATSIVIAALFGPMGWHSRM
jgi:hypothetical protein